MLEDKIHSLKHSSEEYHWCESEVAAAEFREC